MSSLTCFSMYSTAVIYDLLIFLPPISNLPRIIRERLPIGHNRYRVALYFLLYRQRVLVDHHLNLCFAPSPSPHTVFPSSFGHLSTFFAVQHNATRDYRIPENLCFRFLLFIINRFNKFIIKTTVQNTL